MKHIVGIIMLLGVIIFAQFVGSTLNSDAISMMIGVLFGVLAGIPTALLVLVSGRHPHDDRPTRSEPPAPTIVVHSTTHSVTHNYIIPPSVQQGMIERDGDDAIQDSDGNWLILSNNQPVGKMRRLTG